MKKSTYVKDITKENLDVNDSFIVDKKGIFSTKSSSRYVAVTLKDRTGTIEGKIWDRVDELGSLFDKGDLVNVKARSRFYQEKPQLTIGEIRRIEEPLTMEMMKGFFPGSEQGGEKLEADYYSLVEALKNPHLKALLSSLNSDKDRLARFFHFPASVGVHHMYIGGLLEHSLSMAKMGINSCEHIGADRDIVAVGSLLHDIGKIDEITIKGAFRYSDRGRLMGHISLGLLILEDLIKGLGEFPGDLADVLSHIIISHHGVEEWGSPKKPMCIEALIIHYLDNLDAKVMGVKEHMKEKMEDEKWSEYHRLYESRFFKVTQG